MSSLFVVVLYNLFLINYKLFIRFFLGKSVELVQLHNKKCLDLVKSVKHPVLLFDIKAIFDPILRDFLHVWFYFL